LKLTDDVHDLAVAYVGNVLLEGEAENRHPAVFATAPAIVIQDHSHTLASNSSAHGIIHSSAGENNLCMISWSLCPVSEVIGINPNAVATYKAWGKVEKIPFGSGGSEHLRGIDIQLVENCRKLVHERNIEISLRVFNDFGSFRGLNVSRSVNARSHD